jgi:hypothetical protein
MPNELQPSQEVVRSAVQSALRMSQLQTPDQQYELIVALRREADRLEERLSLELLAENATR